MFYSFIRYLCNIIIHLKYKIELKGIDNFPKNGAVIVYSNHKSNWDPVIIGCLLKRPVFFMAKQELFRYPIFSFIFRKLNAFPVSRGKPDRKAIRKALKILEEDKVLGIFPEGTRSKDGKLQEPEPGIALLAAKSSNVIMVPVAVKSNYKWFSPMKVNFGTPKNFNLYNPKGEKLNSRKLKQVSLELFNEVSKLM